MGVYAERNNILTELGYSDYAEYLASPEWKRLRKTVYARDNFLCRCCGATSQVVHHVNYCRETLLGETIDGLLSLCHQCHRLAERDPFGKHRVSLNDTNDILFAICVSHGNPTDWHHRRRPPRKKRQRDETPLKRMRRIEAERDLAGVAQETQDAIRSRFGVGRHGESMRSLAREYGLSKNVVRLILGMPTR